MHAEHAISAARHGKHVLVEKPMALTLDDCTQMIDAAARAGVQLVVGHSHSFDAPIRRTREIIASGTFGAVRMIQALYYTDFLYRPRRPEELDTTRGGGVVWSQAAHQVDIVRLLGRRRRDGRACAHGQLGSRAGHGRRVCRAADVRQRRVRVAHVQRVRTLRLGRMVRLDERARHAESR